MKIEYLPQDEDDVDLIVAVAESDDGAGGSVIIYGSGRSRDEANFDLEVKYKLIKKALTSKSSEEEMLASCLGTSEAEGWVVEIEKAIPYSGVAPYWHCRMANKDLGFFTAKDGETPQTAFMNAKTSIIDDIKSEVSFLSKQMKNVACLKIPEKE